MLRFHGETAQLINTLEKKLSLQKRLKNKGTAMEKAMATVEFDASLFYIARNAGIQDIYQNLLDKMILLICYEYRNSHYDLTHSIEEHILILEAIKKDDPVLVNELIAQHFNHPVDL
jgi:DNA-binding GntR family transcriptional regulator